MAQGKRTGIGQVWRSGLLVMCASGSALLAQTAASPSLSSAALVDAPGRVTAVNTSGDAAASTSRDEAGQDAVPIPQKHKWVYVPEMNLTIGATAQLTATRTANQYGSQYIQGTTPTLGLLAGFHHQIKPVEGYNINFGYTRLTENYQRNNGATDPATGVTSGTYTRGSVPTDVYEVSSMYVVKRPQVGRQYQPFAEAGGGALIFAPTAAPFKGHTSVRAAFAFGGGVEYRMGYHLGLRAEYRGLLYKYPDFGDVLTQVPVSKFFTVTSEPSISLVYRFGHQGGMR